MENTATTVDKNIQDVMKKPEVQAAVATLLEQLPSIATAVKLLARTCDVAKEVMTDGDLLGGVEEAVMTRVAPVQKRIQDATSMIQDTRSMIEEARERAAKDCSKISVFGVLKILREPSVQRQLRFVHALSQVMSERSAKNGTATENCD